MKDNVQDRVIQANDIAYTVIEVAQNKAPAEFVTLDFRYGIADALWDAGYRKTGARVLTTEDEVNALPYGSIIRDNVGDARLKVSENRWWIAGDSGVWPTSTTRFPATVLYVATEDEETDS